MNVLNILRGAYNVARPALRSTAVDTITNPQTYIGLADDVTNTLGRMLPKGFQGGGIQRAPMSVLGQVDDIANMAPGAAREAARNQTARNFRMADRLGDAVRPAGQGPSGALRAPKVGSNAPRPTPATSAPSSSLPGAGPLQRDNEASRALLREAIKQRRALTPAQKATGAGVLAGGGALVASETGAGQGLTDQIQGALNNVGPSIDNFVGGLNIPFQKELQQFGRDQEKRGFGALLDYASGITGVTGMFGLNDLIPKSDPLTPAQLDDIRKKNPGITIPSQTPSKSYVDTLPPELLPPQYNLPEGMGIPINPREMEKYRVRPEGIYGSIPPSVNDDLSGQKYDRSVTLPGAPTINNPPYIPPTTLTPDPVPPTPTPDIGQAMDPYAYQLNVYGQGRQDAATQSSQAAVRDLGLSIHRQLYPGLYKNDGPKTPLQEPSTMNNLDALSELDASTSAVEELIDPTILAQLNAMNLRRSGY
jgi:hypothetical protein